MSSAPSVPGAEVGAPWSGGCGQVLATGALELPAALHRMFGPAAVEMADAAFRPLSRRRVRLSARRCHGACGRAQQMRPGYLLDGRLTH